jgi:hypothetical protein
MVFNISQATSQSSLNQLIQSYYNQWLGDYSIVSLYNLWYYTNTYNNNIVSCRLYYQYQHSSDLTNGYYNAYANYDTTTGLYTFQAGTGVAATPDNNGLGPSQLSQLTLYYPIPISNICFPAGTPIACNQGSIPIEKINPDIHTIRNKKIVRITKTITQDKYLVCFEKDALGTNFPSQKTIISKNHSIFYAGNMRQAKQFVGINGKVYKIKYRKEILYNVLMEEHDKMVVNNLICETLHPENDIAKLYRHLQKLNPEEQNDLINNYNEYVIKNTIFTSKK